MACAILGSFPGYHPCIHEVFMLIKFCLFFVVVVNLSFVTCVCVGGSSLVAKSYPTLYDPMDCSLLGSSVHGISQARILEWVAILYSRVSS